MCLFCATAKPILPSSNLSAVTNIIIIIVTVCLVIGVLVLVVFIVQKKKKSAPRGGVAQKTISMMSIRSADSEIGGKPNHHSNVYEIVSLSITIFVYSIQVNIYRIKSMGSSTRKRAVRPDK